MLILINIGCHDLSCESITVTAKGFIDDSFRVITVDFEAKLTGTGVNIVTDELREYGSVDDLHNGVEGTVIGSIW